MHGSGEEGCFMEGGREGQSASCKRWNGKQCFMQGSGEGESVSCKAVGRERVLHASLWGERVHFM